MKKILFPISSLLIASLLLLNSCGEVETPERYLEINGTSYDLETATLYDWGTDDDISYRAYELTFNSSSSNPSTYLSFMLFSTSTTRIEEGTYDYDYWGYSAGYITNNDIGMNIKYDDGGVAVSGNRFDDVELDFEGTVTVSKENDDYKFEFNLTAEEEDESYTIRGVYNDALTQL